VAIEKGKYLIPSRTQKSSPSSPMVLYTRVWESRSLPSFFFRLNHHAVIEVFFSLDGLFSICRRKKFFPYTFNCTTNVYFFTFPITSAYFREFPKHCLGNTYNSILKQRNAFFRCKTTQKIHSKYREGYYLNFKRCNSKSIRVCIEKLAEQLNRERQNCFTDCLNALKKCSNCK
jgi:hypothetical protein